MQKSTCVFKHSTKEIMQELYHALPFIKDAAQGLKPHGHDELAGPCPFCGGCDRFVIFTTGKDRFICRHCAPEGMDRIEFYRRLWGYNRPIELARDIVQHMFDSSIPAPPPRSKPRPEAPTATRQEEKPIPDHTIYLEKLPNHQESESHIMTLFAENRGISRQVVKPHIMGENLRYTVHMKVPAVAVPYFGLNGGIPAVQILSIAGKEKPFPGGGTDKVFLKGSRCSAPCFFHAGVSMGQTDALMLHEGVIDALSGAQLFPWACHLALGGSTYTRKVNDLKKMITTNIKRIVVCQDNDPAGSKMLYDIRAILGGGVSGINWGPTDKPGMDINDLIRSMPTQEVI